jgi:hypothetical protein
VKMLLIKRESAEALGTSVDFICSLVSSGKVAVEDVPAFLDRLIAEEEA